MIYEFLVEALEELRPLRTFCISGEKLIDNISWAEPNNIPTDVEIIETAERLQVEYDANAYARSRKTAYDALNQLELISDDAINGTTTHADAILAIKAEFPKPV